MTSAELIARIKKQPIGFACGLICLLCIGWLYYRSGALEQRQAEFEAESAKAAKFSSNVSISKNLSEQVAELQGVTKELESRLMKAGQFAVNQQYFYRLEAENEVKLLDVRQNPLPRNAKSVYVGVPYNVNVQGSYKNAMAFLQRLEKGRHFCRINNATFSKVALSGEGSLQNAGSGMTLTLTLELLGQP
jgi:Tfp pilus assembly protein PilO